MANTNDRANSRETENEDLKPGDPPRPASEPGGAKGSSSTPKTQTDPATGAPNKSRPDTAAGG